MSSYIMNQFILQLETYRLALTKVLQIEFINNSYFFFSLWSVIHIFSGMLYMGYLLFRGVKKPFLWLFLGLLGYEIVEWWAIGQFPYFFLPETYIDAVSDIVVGFIAGLVVWLFRKK